MKTTKRIQKTVASVLSLSLLAFAAPAQAGHVTGNGGDYVRGTFLRMGHVVLDYLKDSEAGAQIISENALDMGSLEGTLNIDVVSVDEGSLIDNGGSSVDAIGTPGEITLDKTVWMDHFEKNRDVYYLVFHEMLRAIAVNDDNYVISKALDPFPQTRRIVTKITPTYPLIGDDLLSSMIDSTKIAINGTGCPVTRAGTLADFDLERNVLDLTFTNYTLTAGGGSSGIARKACALAIPVNVPAGKKLIVSQIDMFSKVDFKSNSNGQMNIEAFLAGTQGPQLKKTVATTDSDLQGRLLLRRNDVLASNCGGADNLRLNTSGLVQHSGDAASRLAVDRISISFKVESCSTAAPAPTPTLIVDPAPAPTPIDNGNIGTGNVSGGVDDGSGGHTDGGTPVVVAPTSSKPDPSSNSAITVAKPKTKKKK